jgi:hypothetical protein
MTYRTTPPRRRPPERDYSPLGSPVEVEAFEGCHE